ncbi:putative serine/threonine-protein kinase PBL21 [Sesamum alatum]|uniref:non-specific serine/threonine protein kinase n=1 Tax=Sesamum alatum TaxID=300844 RepID=A0AAE2CTP7_9LAMI|nr:putative serine/threonine-protein kinase PBL21 [Sesamum alatum]
MNCFSCMNPKFKDVDIDEDMSPRSIESSVSGKGKPIVNDNESAKKGGSVKAKGKDSKDSVARSFSFKELSLATQSFKEANLIGEGGFGCVYKGRLESGMIVAVKQLNHEGLQGNQEFVVEVLMLSLLHHPNLVNLIGYCSDRDQRLLVYEFMPMGSLENHLFELTYYKMHELIKSLTFLTLLQSRPFLKDRKNFVQMVDPLLEGRYSVKSVQQAVVITSMCIHEQANVRPNISDVVHALEYLASQADTSRKGRSHVPASPIRIM